MTALAVRKALRDALVRVAEDRARRVQLAEFDVPFGEARTDDPVNAPDPRGPAHPWHKIPPHWVTRKPMPLVHHPLTCKDTTADDHGPADEPLEQQDT